MDLRPEIVAAVAPLLDAAIDRIADRVVEKMRAEQATRYLSQSEVGRLLGKSPKAMSAYLARPNGTDLLAIAVTLDGVRRWKSADLEALISRQGTTRLRAVGADK